MKSDKKVIPNYKYWLRGGKLTQNHHLEMTEEELKNAATCKGLVATHPCKKPIYLCTECGNYGCSYEVPEKCPEQGFRNDKCLHCGAVGTRVPVMKDQMEEIIAQWEKDVPET